MGAEHNVPGRVAQAGFHARRFESPCPIHHFSTTMPELPEVETVRLGLAPVMEGRILVDPRVYRRDLRRPFPAEFRARIIGRRVLSVDRRAKYLLIRLDDDGVIIVHLGMSGRMLIQVTPPDPPGKHDHVVLVLDDGRAVVFNDPRRFGLMDLTTARDLPDHPDLRDLGPEPIGNAFSGALLAERVGSRRSAIKVVLLDQNVVAGLGNIYASESLFQAGIAPDRPAASLSPGEFARLADAARDVIARAIAAGGSTLRDHRTVDGDLGYFQHSFAVYGREGEACPGCDCDPDRDGGIRRAVQGGRSTYFCPRRQR